MNAIANIIVQLVHIDGSQKGEIQELTCPIILFGRHADCQVRFPKDAVTLSRKHAQIVREDNRFKLIDRSTNGTFVNGQQVSEAYLKEGDVITFTKCGPKISFLTRTNHDQPGSFPRAPSPPEPVVESVETTLPPQSAMPSSSAQLNQSVTIPFTIQYGPMLKTFRSLPITLGKGAHCDFVVSHPALYDQQAQIFFGQGQYWIKDLTGGNAILVNDMPITGQAALQPDMQLALSPNGPRFRFLGSGRLVEYDASLTESSPEPPPLRAAPEVSRQPGKLGSLSQKAESLVRRFFKKNSHR